MWRIVALSFLLLSNLSDAQVPERLRARDAFRYLELTAEQVKTLTTIRAPWVKYRADATQRAGSIEAAIKSETRRVNPDRNAIGKQQIELQNICGQSQARHLQVTTELRALLASAQLAKLAAIEEAFTLMPVIESAQSLEFMSSVLAGPPAGMPDGKLEVEFTYVRATVAPLPGCRPALQVIRSGANLDESGKSASH